MAWSLQNRCAIEEDFDDEDFLLAVEDAETSLPSTTPAVSRCLRPISSGLQSPSTARLISHQQSREVTCNDSSNLSPVLSCQNTNRLAAGMALASRPASCLRPLPEGQAQQSASLCMALRSPSEVLTLEGSVSAASTTNTSTRGGKPCPPSAAGFRFVSKPSPVGDLADDGLDDDLFLSACTEVELPSIHSDLSKPSQLTLGAPSGNPTLAPWREQGFSKEPASKRLRVMGGRVTPDPSNSLQGGGRQNSDPALVNPSHVSIPSGINIGLSLRPSSVGERQGVCPPGTSRTVFAVQNVQHTHSSIEKSGYQAARPFPGSVCPSEVGVSSRPTTPASFCSMRSPVPLPSEMRTFRLPVSPAPDCLSPSMPGSISRQPHRLRQEPRSLMTCIASPAGSPRVPCGSSSASGALHPVVTNHLVQLVTAANQTPRAASGSALHTKTRRFPGPAGILPHQHSGRNLEEILVSTPYTPTHGALARMRTQESSSSQQPVEEEFGRGPWMTMKAELGLDEKNPACFLQTYSVIMVLRKAALKQLPKNKVPNMAVMVKSLVRASVDASAVFRDPTGEIQGTVHHMLLEEREGDLKAGSVLLLQQVGVFSPSSRNHYLNVTPNNLVKIYPADTGDGRGQSSQLHEDSTPTNAGATAFNSQGQHLRRRLHDDLNCNRDVVQSPADSMSAFFNLATETSEHRAATGDWDMDDLDSVMGELPEDSLFSGGSHR